MSVELAHMIQQACKIDSSQQICGVFVASKICWVETICLITYSQHILSDTTAHIIQMHHRMNLNKCYQYFSWTTVHTNRQTKLQLSSLKSWNSCCFFLDSFQTFSQFWQVCRTFSCFITIVGSLFTLAPWLEKIRRCLRLFLLLMAIALTRLSCKVCEFSILLYYARKSVTTDYVEMW